MIRLLFSDQTLQRVAHLRAQGSLLKDTEVLDRSRFLILVGDKFATYEDQAFFDYRTLQSMDHGSVKLLSVEHTVIFLGTDGDAFHFGVVIPEGRGSLSNNFFCTEKPVQWKSIRQLGGEGECAVANRSALLFSLARWHATHRFCGQCGQSTEVLDSGYRRQCTGGTCGRDVFPRIDPVVLVLVERIDPVDGTRFCLLAKNVNSRNDDFSPVAGFVEPGETIEGAAVREVAEETGVTVENVRLVANQPWPFPHSLIFGAIARAASELITIDPLEIADARWFSEVEVAEKLQKHDLTRPLSMDLFLLAQWIGVDPQS